MMSSKSPKTKIFNFMTCFIFLISLSFINNYLQDEECPREKPILKSNECQVVYCTQEEFEKNVCVISNSFIKTQWMNNLHIFNEVDMRHISVTKSFKGDLFLSSHKVADDYDKYLYGFNSEGDGLFYDEKKDKYTSFEIIDFPIREYADYNNYVEIDNKGYLMGVPLEDDIYLVDYINKTAKYFSIRPIAKSADTIFKMNGHDNDTFFTAYTACNDTFGKNCFLHFQSFKLNFTSQSIIKVKNYTNVPAVTGNRINCFQNENGTIFCFYVRNHGTSDKLDLKYTIALFNPETFGICNSIIIDQNFTATPIFEEVLHLRDTLYVIAYATDEDTIKILFKKISVMDSSLILSYTNYFTTIKEININQDKKFVLKSGSYKKNSICKINDNKFAILLKDLSRQNLINKYSILLIYIFTIFNDNQNINMRRYSIDYELYNKHYADDVKGYTLGDFFGVILGLTYDISSTNYRATFMTFGYVNSTEQEIYDNKLKYNNTDSKIVLKDYINEIENNLFGYEFVGVKILSLPNEEDSGYFLNNNTDKKIEKDTVLDINSTLQFILSDNYKTDVYSIVFAGVVSEPSYDKMNEFAEELVEYPENQNISEKDFYEPKTLMGRKVNFKFRLSKCYDSCETCTALSEDENDQKCIKCREGFYFKEGTNNCYDKIDSKYYFDEDTKMFSPCYQDCYTCSYKGDSKAMNCLTCDYNLHYYNKSKNCMNCTKYINYEQNECIETIPDGYYLEDSELGILGKCYYLCKTCTAGPYTKSGHYYMNCKTCLYNNSKYTPPERGDCPDSSDDSEDDTPVDKKCSFNKPILRDGKCQLIYCTPEEYQSEICIIYNPIVKAQWLNSFHIFSDESTSSVCSANDIISDEKTILLAQSQEMGYTEKYLYGFNKNGTGIFYDKEKNLFDTYKKLSWSFSQNLIGNMAYIEIDSDQYLLTTPIEDILYLIDYNTGKIVEEKKIDSSAYFTDRVILKQKKTSSKEAEYLVDYIYSKESKYYIMMKNFQAKDGKLNEISYLTSSVQVHPNSNLKCYKDDNNYLKCTYNKVNDDSSISHVLGIFSAFTNQNIELVKEFELEKNYDTEPSFDSMIEWDKTTYIIAYSLPDNKNSIKVLLKKVFNDISTSAFTYDDYISSIPSIIINEDSLYNFYKGEAKKNSLYRLSDEKFVMMVNNFKDNQNSGIVIFVFTVYDYYSKINVRHYPMSFKLYNTLVDGKLVGYNINGLFGALIELTSPGNENVKRASFFTFGYINATNDVQPMDGYDILFKKNKKIIVKDYFTEIENNLFGYQLSNINVRSVPDKNKAGIFSIMNQYTGTLVNNDNITIKAEISFYPSSNPTQGNYSIVLSPLIKEPNYYEDMSNYCQKLESYPLDQNDTEKKFYTPKIYHGKHFSFNFFMEGTVCFENCDTCTGPSEDKDDQKCKECKANYYKIYETDNCFDKIETGYYLDEEKKVFMPCYKDCLTCDKSGVENNMNCLSCKNEFKFYKKSKNCLNCPKFVNFEQTGCIEEVPEGYFIEDENLGTIGKCNESCKTCEKGEETIEGKIHMNCKVCKFTNSSYAPEFEGNCPDADGEKKDEGEDGGNKGNENDGGSSYMWILYTSIVLVVIIVLIILIRKYCLLQKSNDYSKMGDENSKARNISMENTSGLGIE